MELDSKAMAFGIGRKATDAELLKYLLKRLDEKPIPLEEALLRYRAATNDESTDIEPQSI